MAYHKQVVLNITEFVGL